MEYEKDKAAMRQMAREHREALVKAANQTQNLARSGEKGGGEGVERWRSVTGKDVVSN